MHKIIVEHLRVVKMALINMKRLKKMEMIMYTHVHTVAWICTLRKFKSII